MFHTSKSNRNHLKSQSHIKSDGEPSPAGSFHETILFWRMRRFSSTQLCRSQSWSQKSVGFHPRCPQTCCGHCTPQWYCDPAPAPPQFLQSCYPKMPPREVLKYLQLLPWAGAQLQQPAADLGLVPKNLPGNPWVFGDMLFIWICLNWYRLKAIIQPMLQPSQKGTCTWAALGLLFFIFLSWSSLVQLLYTTKVMCDYKLSQS